MMYLSITSISLERARGGQRGARTPDGAAERKRTPRAAMRSRLGVRFMGLSPMAPMQSQRNWSEITRITLGRAAAEAEDRAAAEVLRELMRRYVADARRRRFEAEARRQSQLIAGSRDEAEVMRWIGDVSAEEGGR